MLEMLSEARVIFQEEVRRTVRRRAYVLITLSVPALLLIVLAAVPVIRGIVEDKEEEEPKPIGIVNLSESLSFDTEPFPGFVLLAGREDGVEELAQEDIKELFVIPEDYLVTGKVEWLHSGGGSPRPSDSSAETIIAILRGSIASNHVPPELLTRALAGAEFERARLGQDGIPLDEDLDVLLGKVILSAIATLLLVFAMMLGSGALLQAVTEEKESRMIEVLLTSARPLSLMTAKVLAVGAAGLATTLIWVG